jgi:hypothetical protein
MTYYKYKSPSFAVQKGKISVLLTIFFGLIFMSVAYLAQINNMVAKNFELRELQTSLKNIQDTNQQLTISLMQSRSLSNLEEAAKSLNLVSVDKIEHLKIPSGVFVLSQR